MIISVNWLKQFTPIDTPIDELTELIGARLVEIEDVTDLSKKYKGVVVAKVIECEELKGSDHLNVTKIDDGGVVEDVERDENGFVQVVCGAPNVRAGLSVAWLPPKSTVPESFGDKEPFVLSARKLRGTTSNGMLASAKELDLFEDHTGILEIDKDAKPGTSFAELYELDDYLIDIENKSLTHRPDAFGIIGFAREVAAIQGKQFTTPAWLMDTTPTFIDKVGDVVTPAVTIDTPELSAKYTAIVMSDADTGVQSPLDIQTYLSRVGVRPINAIVDVTNYLMMLTGQPLHAFDYDKLIALNEGKADIHVRSGRTDETLKLLDGRTIELSENDIVIANGDVPVALAGAMGGAATEIDETTKNIIIESATFNLYNLRNTQMRHGIFSEAITRFTKGQPAALCEAVLAAAVRLIAGSTGAVRSSDIAAAVSNVQSNDPITLTVEQLNETLGSKFSTADIVDTLQNVEFMIPESDDASSITAVAPFWRSDIHIPEDIIEEVGRLNGFDTIEPTLPLRDFTAISPDSFDQMRSTIRHTLARAGANEVLTYSFVHGDVLTKSGLSPDNSYKITNSISPDLQYYRQSLTPSLLGLVHSNIKSGFDTFALFELNKVHTKTAELTSDGVPVELDRVGLVVAGKKSNGATYYEARKILDYLASSLGLSLEYKPFTKDASMVLMTPFEYRRSARVIDVKSGIALGVIGEYKKSVAKHFKLSARSAGFELLGEGLALAVKQVTPAYVPATKYPSSERDVCYKVATSVTYAAIVTALHEAKQAHETVAIDIQPVDIYQAPDTDTKNITIRIAIAPMDKTLTNEEVTAIVDRLSKAVVAATQATVI
ncbi:phenylalanine--tRNA ligase subunit beta [Candidatus Saccharibacteria bacterium RIFCSPHIGHO2_01_FULL_45_15]|nr:MAG: phenylalanine--tRNA ligase subunit beta [Candidatus Saccharibacteria bacterium RIFCSPHIGHO2_01_FULL_45_15]OGL27766.1 MAG: phenylalanine--tRNA ligase subunit beta [Candidatus Saccharibacteria bacterium RIFCSPHIGHO2_02_FULL_46_12]OGL31655.1 MAG: phenylalanine--tRNA ligase subunit beta [Candidatus Saccharibacteria bacterium RIFCSPHIGHO2_12_FULL_44_22]